MIRIVFVGQKHWSQMCAACLQRLEDPRIDVSSYGIDTGADVLSPRAFGRLTRAHIIVRVGFRPGSNTRSGRMFETFWNLASLLNPKARAVYYWIGTDVSLAVAQVSSGQPTTTMYRLSDKASHLVVSDDLGIELASIGIMARTLPNPWTLKKFPETPPPMPAKFTVLTYIPDDRPLFYGGPAIIKAASVLPEVDFVVMGGTGTWTNDRPGNLQFVGWVDDVGRRLEMSSVLIRMIEHDGQGNTVLEGLLYGRHVIYSMPRPHCTRVAVDDAAGLVRTLEGWLALHREGRLAPNTEGAAWAHAHFAPNHLSRLLADSLIDEVCE